MTAGEFTQFCKTMREFGVAYAKFGDCEIRLGSDPQPYQTTVTQPLSYKDPQVDQASLGVTAPLTKEQEEDIKHKMEELKSVMQIGDEDLVDRLFPEPVEDPAVQ